jgi:hypothetical protein
MIYTNEPANIFYMYVLAALAGQTARLSDDAPSANLSHT